MFSTRCALYLIPLLSTICPAGIITSLHAVPPAPGQLTEVRVFDLAVTMTEEHDFHSTRVLATTSSGAILLYGPNEPRAGGPMAPSMPQMLLAPSYAWSSFASTPLGYPNSHSVVAAPIYTAISGPWTEWMFNAEWYDTAVTGNGTYVVGRFAIQDANTSSALKLEGYAVAKIVSGPFAGDYLLTGFSYVVPEPAVIMLLLAGLCSGCAWRAVRGR